MHFEEAGVVDVFGQGGSHARHAPKGRLAVGTGAGAEFQEEIAGRGVAELVRPVRVRPGTEQQLDHVVAMEVEGYTYVGAAVLILIDGGEWLEGKQTLQRLGVVFPDGVKHRVWVRYQHSVANPNDGFGSGLGGAVQGQDRQVGQPLRKCITEPKPAASWVVAAGPLRAAPLSVGEAVVRHGEGPEHLTEAGESPGGVARQGVAVASASP